MRFGDVGYLGLEMPAVRAQTSVWTVVDVCERLVASLLLAVSCPLIVAAIIAISLLSRRSPLIAHRRVARGGRPFWVFKLRTMWDGHGIRTALVEFINPEGPESILPKTAHDPRVTSVFAAFCRRYSVDELPQLWHVIRGEMALVGPRPLTQLEVERYYGVHSAKLLARKPGLTGLWQIRGRSRLGYRQRRRLDLFLVQKWSLRLYLKILLATPFRVLSGKDAW